MKTYTDKYGRVYAIVQADGCRGCDFYKDVQACKEAPDCDGINYKEISEEKTQNETKEDSVSTEKKAHKHAELIKLWAAGESVQVRRSEFDEWSDTDLPTWSLEFEYRIKPEEKKPVVRWLWTYECAGGWYTCNFFRTEEEMLEYHDKDSIIKLEWTRTEFPK